MQRYSAAILMVAFFSGGAFAADDVASAVVVTVKSIDKAAKTAAVKSADGTEYAIRFTGHTLAHGVEATAHGSKDALLSLKEGDDVIVHYTVKGGVKTADEVDHIGKDGLKMTVVAIKSVDHAAKVVTVKTADGAEETYHLTDRAARESAKGLDKAGKVTIYYSDDAGKKLVHYLKQS